MSAIRRNGRPVSPRSNQPTAGSSARLMINQQCLAASTGSDVSGAISSPENNVSGTNPTSG